jgi:hypothetical protein
MKRLTPGRSHPIRDPPMPILTLNCPTRPHSPGPGFPPMIGSSVYDVARFDMTF